MVGHVLLLKIAHGRSSVLLVLVRIDLEFVAMDTVLFRTALGKMPKVAAGGFSSLRARHPRMPSCELHLATARWTVLLVGFEDETRTARPWEGS